MDYDQERIPIDVGVEQASTTNANETRREDGTLVVDLLAQSEPETECTQSTAANGETIILVCGTREEADTAPDGSANEPDKVQLQFGDNATATLTAESEAVQQGLTSHNVGVTVKIKF